MKEAFVSQASTPFGSRENLKSPQSPNQPDFTDPTQKSGVSLYIIIKNFFCGCVMHVIRYKQILYKRIDNWCFCKNVRAAASAPGHAARTSAASGGQRGPIDNRHVSGHVHEEGKISKQAHVIWFRGRKNTRICAVVILPFVRNYTQKYSNSRWVSSWSVILLIGIIFAIKDKVS